MGKKAVVQNVLLLVRCKYPTTNCHENSTNREKTPCNNYIASLTENCKECNHNYTSQSNAKIQKKIISKLACQDRPSNRRILRENYVQSQHPLRKRTSSMDCCPVDTGSSSPSSFSPVLLRPEVPRTTNERD